DAKPETDNAEPLLVIPLGPKVMLTPGVAPEFDNSTRPRASVEYLVEPASLCRWTLAARGEKMEDLKKMELPALLRKVLETSTGEQVKTAAIQAQATAAQRAKLDPIVGDDLKDRTLRQMTKVAKWGLAETRDETGKRVEYRFKSTLPKD